MAIDDQCEEYHFQSPFHPGDSCHDLYNMNPETHNRSGYCWILDGPKKVFCVGTRRLCWHNNEHNRYLKALSIMLA